jgi:AraC-like DNA-binding protein
MAITISQQDYWDLLSSPAASPISTESSKPLIVQNEFLTGHYCEFELREGVTLEVIEEAYYQDLEVILPDRPHPIELSYTLLSQTNANLDEANAGQYIFCGSGMAPRDRLFVAAHQPNLRITLHIEPAVLTNYFPEEVQQFTRQQWLRSIDQTYFTRLLQTTTAMQLALQQIRQCPYQGATQRLYLESKVWELVALHLAQDSCAQGTLAQEATIAAASASKPLKADDIERICYAKDLLMARLDAPPSLLELARLSGINDHKLKVGFRQVFGTTVFGYLHDRRLERSQQLLATGELSVTEVTKMVGFANRSHFAAAFRKRFGVNPRDYRRIQVS